MIKFTLTPYDVLFFGSGRPFNRGDVVASVFPPHPNTLASAICSRIYHLKNIDVSKILKAVYGPFIKKDEEIYFPKPHNIYKERKKKEIEKLFVVKPLDKSLKLFNPENTNKPQIQTFPVYKGIEEVEPFSAFISSNGLKKWLNNQEINKNDILQYKKIFENESRIGIKIDPSLYSVGGGEDALYRIEFLRLKEDVKFVFWVEFNFSELKKIGLNDEDGIFEFFNDEPRVLKLGGEMKNVSYEIEESDFKEWIRNELRIEGNLKLNNGDRILILFLTYGVFDFQINDFQIYSACFENYEIIGINSKNLKRKTKRAFPPGSVLWLESKNEKEINNPTFMVKKNNFYEINEPEGIQEFIGTNLILIKKEVKNV
jgi:CRISPR-associated protein Cmr3